MAQRVLAGVSPVEFYDPTNMNLICTSKTLTDEGIATAVSEDRITGGASNQLISKYYYDSSFKLNLTDSLFSLEYLAMKLGQAISYGADIEFSETIVTKIANQITTTNKPVPFPATNLVVGAYKLGSTLQDEWNTIVFDQEKQTAQVPELPVGTQVCVKYFYTDAGARSFKVSSNIIPTVVYAVMKIPEFKAGIEGGSYTTSSQVGTLQVVVPQFIFDPNTELAVTSSGHATMSLSGEALSNYSGDCDGSSYYAILSETTFGGDEFSDIKKIVVGDSDINLKVSESQMIQLYGMYGGIVSPRLLNNTSLTFTSSSDSIATVDDKGKVVAVSAGEAIIECVVTSKPNLSAKAVVTVS